MLPWKLRKRQILLVSQNLSSLYFSLAKFQLVSCNLSLAIIWQMTYTQKLPKLCSATLNHVTRWSPVRFQATAASKWPTCWQLVSFDLQISSWSFRWRYLPFLQLRGSTLFVFFFQECLTMCSEGKEMCKVVVLLIQTYCSFDVLVESCPY